MKRMRGNILFIILLAVVLFAALSYAVTNSIRGGGKDGGDENAKTAATDIINYATLIENEVMRAMLVGGVEWNELNFYNQFSRGVSSGSYANAFTSNPNCASIQASPLPCAIFTDRGGSIPPRHFWEYTTKIWLGSNGYPATGDARFYAKEVDNIGTPLSEIVMYIVQLKSSVCVMPLMSN